MAKEKRAKERRAKGTEGATGMYDVKGEGTVGALQENIKGREAGICRAKVGAIVEVKGNSEESLLEVTDRMAGGSRWQGPAAAARVVGLKVLWRVARMNQDQLMMELGQEPKPGPGSKRWWERGWKNPDSSQPSEASSTRRRLAPQGCSGARAHSQGVPARGIHQLLAYAVRRVGYIKGNGTHCSTFLRICRTTAPGWTYTRLVQMGQR